MKGNEKILKSLNQLTKYPLINVNDGYEIYPTSDIAIKIHCFEPIGWNVFIEYKEAYDDNDILLLYSKIEGIIDEVNYEFYNQDENIEYMLESGFNNIEKLLVKYNEFIVEEKREPLSYKAVMYNKSEFPPEIEIQYSIRNNSWSLRIKNFFDGDNMIDDLFEIYSKIKSFINELNDFAMQFQENLIF